MRLLGASFCAKLVEKPGFGDLIAFNLKYLTTIIIAFKLYCEGVRGLSSMDKQFLMEEAQAAARLLSIRTKVKCQFR
jgi:hypothetical protein